MKTWPRYVAIFMAALAMWTLLHKLALRYGPPVTAPYSFEATACVQIRETAIHEWVEARDAASLCETRVPPVETRLAELESTAQVLQTAVIDCATETPITTPTRTPRPTSTPTPMGLLCKLCTLGAADGTLNGCGPGFLCWYCAGVGYRCVNPDTINGSCTTCRNVGAVSVDADQGDKLEGLAVWNNDTKTTTSGEPFDPQALTCAVDPLLWRLRGRTLLICTIPGKGVNAARCVRVRVNDTGPLAEQGLFVYESRPRGMLTVTRWWQGDGIEALPIIVDLTPAAMDLLTGGTRETCLVTVEVMEAASDNGAFRLKP